MGSESVSLWAQSTFHWICFLPFSTQISATGFKTRHFSDIIFELAAALRIHADSGSRLGGVSLEFTGEVDEEGFSVTECLGGSMQLKEEELGLRYQASAKGLVLDAVIDFFFVLIVA